MPCICYIVTHNLQGAHGTRHSRFNNNFIYSQMNRYYIGIGCLLHHRQLHLPLIFWILATPTYSLFTDWQPPEWEISILKIDRSHRSQSAFTLAAMLRGAIQNLIKFRTESGLFEEIKVITRHRPHVSVHCAVGYILHPILHAHTRNKINCNNIILLAWKSLSTSLSIRINAGHRNAFSACSLAIACSGTTYHQTLQKAKIQNPNTMQLPLFALIQN